MLLGEEQTQIFMQGYTKQDAEDKQRNFKMCFLAGAYTNWVAENDVWQKNCTDEGMEVGK